jgi:NADPH:quinone reductase-like Zn-dependent oxidoreductase
MRQVWIPRAGPPEVLELREAPDPEPAAGEVRIRVEAAGVNFADVMARLGLYGDLPPMPVVVGYEVAGRVDRVGAGVAADAWVGRDVLALTRFGGYSDVVCVPERQVAVRRPGLSAEQGASIPVTYLTAWQLLHVMGSLKAGETVLVHSAGGGVGLAAVQLARHAGARVIGIASAGKHAVLREEGVEHCIDGREEDWEARVRALTGGRGVELVLDAVGGASFKKSFRVLAPTGRLGMFGFSTAATGPRKSLVSLLKGAAQMPWFSFDPVTLMNGNRGVFGVNVGRLWEEGERVRGWLDAVLALEAQGVVRPRVAATFPLAEAGRAHQFLQDRRNLGKVLLTTGGPGTGA